MNAKTPPINCGCHIWRVENNPLLGSDISEMVHTKTCTVLQCSLIMFSKRSNIKRPRYKGWSTLESLPRLLDDEY